MCFGNIMMMSYITSTLYITHQGSPFSTARWPGASKITSWASGFGQIFFFFFILADRRISKFLESGKWWFWEKASPAHQSPYQINTMRTPLIARFMGPTWGPSGAARTQVGPMLASWTLLSGTWITYWNVPNTKLDQSRYLYRSRYKSLLPKQVWIMYCDIFIWLPS